MKRPKDVLFVQGGFAAFCATIGLIGVIGGGRALGVAAVPLGLIMTLGSLYVACNRGDVADHVGQYTRETAAYRAQRGYVSSGLLLKLAPDQEGVTRSVAWGSFVMGLILTAMGLVWIASLVWK